MGTNLQEISLLSYQISITIHIPTPPDSSEFGLQPADQPLIEKLAFQHQISTLLSCRNWFAASLDTVCALCFTGETQYVACLFTRHFIQSLTLYME